MLTWSSGGDLRRYERDAEDRARVSKARRQTESGIPTAEQEMGMGMGPGMGMGMGMGLGVGVGLETRLETGLETKLDDGELKPGPTKGNKKAKRQMQNRMAQRAFRARSKVQHQEVSWYSKYLFMPR